MTNPSVTHFTNSFHAFHIWNINFVCYHPSCNEISTKLCIGHSSCAIMTGTLVHFRHGSGTLWNVYRKLAVFSLNKKSDILQTFWNGFFNENDWNVAKIVLKSVHKDPFPDKTLVEVMAWCRLVKEQAITSTDVDQHLCRHMELLGQKRLTLKAKQNGNILQTAFWVLKKKIV